MKSNLKNNLSKPIMPMDLWVGIFFITLITFQPFYLRGEINIFELGLYLPGIQAVLNGLVPYRDFFHLRGPMELYFPAALMQLFGQHVAVLSTYFYIGTILTLIIFSVIASKLFQSRLFFYLFTAVLVARTFPRVVFTYWGGLRYGVGALAILLAIMFFKSRNNRWLLASGFISAIAFLMSIEIGLCSLVGVMGGLILCNYFSAKKVVLKDYLSYGVTFLVVVGLYFIYLISQNAFSAYVEATFNVAQNMQPTFNLGDKSNVLEGSSQILSNLVNPSSENFKHLTPVYLYLILVGYLVFKLKRGKDECLPAVICLAGYGLMLYITSLRNALASQFEMALQPEKIIYFFLIERAYSYIKEIPKEQRIKRIVQWFMIFVLVGSSVGYSLSRFSHRFIAFKYLTFQSPDKLIPSKNKETEMLNLPRIKGMVVPSWQAQDFNELVSFLNEHTNQGEQVLMYPELGFYSFITDRSFVGRFPIADFAWLNESWHQEYIQDLKIGFPKYAVMDLKLHRKFEEQYFIVNANRVKYDEVMDFVQKHYKLVYQTPSLGIYQKTTHTSGVGEAAANIRP